MSLVKYEVFNTVIELGSLTKAAESLNLTQSAVSYSISNLESEFGFPLLVRNRSGISLTENGNKMLSYIRQILSLNEKMQQEAALIQGIELGTVRIGAFTSVCIEWLPSMIKKFKEEHPSITIKLLQGGYQDIEDWIKAGVVDFGFVTTPKEVDFDIISLKRDPMYCILSKNHPLSNQKEISIKQLKSEPFIIPKAGYDNDIKKIFEETGVNLNIEFEMADDQAIIAMVENGLGVSIIPELVLKAYHTDVSIHKLKEDNYRNISIAATSLKDISPAAKTFIDSVIESLK